MNALEAVPKPFSNPSHYEAWLFAHSVR